MCGCLWNSSSAHVHTGDFFHSLLQVFRNIFCVMTVGAERSRLSLDRETRDGTPGYRCNVILTARYRLDDACQLMMRPSSEEAALSTAFRPSLCDWNSRKEGHVKFRFGAQLAHCIGKLCRDVSQCGSMLRFVTNSQYLFISKVKCH